MGMGKVAIVRGPSKPSENQVEANVRKAIELVGGLDGIKSSDIVLIKPNICAPAAPRSAVYTNPVVCKAIANMVRETGATAIIAESCGVADDTESCIRANGYDRLRAEGYEVMDLKGEKTTLTKISIPKGRVLKKVTLPNVVLDAKMIISVPVMKTQMGQKVTLSLKNMKGILPDSYKKNFHRIYGVAQAMVDLLTVVRPDLAVVDGILAMEGLGPMLGTPVEMGIVVAGKDAVAVDAVTCSVMGFDPEEIPIVDGASKAGIGTADLKKIEVVGASIKEVQRRFKRVEEAVEETITFPAGLKVLIGEKACTGCREIVMAALRDMHVQKKLDLLKGWTIVAGQIEKPPKADKARLLLVGACTAKHQKLGIYVSGCCPWPWDITEAAIGEEHYIPWHDKSIS